MMQLASFIAITLGGVLMLYSAIRYYRLMGKDMQNQLSSGRTYRIISFGLMLSFIVGYAVIAAEVLAAPQNTMLHFAGFIFFLGAVFVFFTALYINKITHFLRDQNEQIALHSKTLEAEVERRVQEVLWQDKILHTVNELSSVLLASETENFEHSIWKSMGMLVQSVNVDRMYIWKNHQVGGKLLCTQMYEWSENAEPQQGNELTTDISYDDVAPGWEGKLSSGQSINGIVKDLSKEEREHLQAQGVMSILVVPVFMNNYFWGFVGFDDCQRERLFSDAEESILRSASMLIATAMLRNEMTQGLMDAREEALASTQAKSTFLSNMSHEIRTPINAISGMAAIARKSHDMTRIYDCLDKIDAATRQLLAIINDILDMSKIEAGKMELAEEPFNLRGMLYNVRSIVGVRATEKKQTFTLDIADDVPEAVTGDDVRLSQVLINLLSNAIKFTPEGGRVSLRVRLKGQKDGLYRIAAEVEDNGIGISEEQRRRLFQAFEQAEKTTARSFGGTGLGLAISRSIAQMMQGDISVESEMGSGSCFRVEVSLRAADEQAIKDRQGEGKTAEKDLAGITVLLVEDIEINREIVQVLLGEKGVKIDAAENGKIAVEMFASQPDRYDMILMDIHMPVMDGYTATQKIRGMNIPQAQAVPIIAMTANAFSDDVLQCLRVGMNDHIAKPIDTEKLYQVMSAYV